MRSLFVAVSLVSLIATAPALAEAPDISAKAAVLLDVTTGDVLYAEDPDTARPTASLSKIMTARVVFDALSKGQVALSDEVLISERAWRTGGSRTFLEVGSRVTVEDLLRGLIIQSGNDAAVALAEHLGGSVEGFAPLMNKTAKRLGMENSRFVTPHGLPAKGHEASAHDLALLAMSIFRDHADMAWLFSERIHTHNNITQRSRNPLLGKVDGVDGMKTGYTSAAGYGLITSAERDGRRIVSVIMGEPSPKHRARDGRALVNYAFEAFDLKRIARTDEPVAVVPVVHGEKTRIPLVATEDYAKVIEKGSVVVAEALLPDHLTAPVMRGATVGKIVVEIDDEKKEIPVVAGADVGRRGFWARVGDTVSSWVGVSG